jgi:hypothetical protein
MAAAAKLLPRKIVDTPRHIATFTDCYLSILFPPLHSEGFDCTVIINEDDDKIMMHPFILRMITILLYIQI